MASVIYYFKDELDFNKWAEKFKEVYGIGETSSEQEVLYTSAKIILSGAVIRTGPDTNTDQICVGELDQVFTLVSSAGLETENGNWYEIYIDEFATTGWIEEYCIELQQ